MKVKRDLNTELKFPVISWSSMNAFISYDKEVWYQQYVLGKRGPVNSAMHIGISVGERIIADPSFLPAIPRPEIFEQKLSAVLGNVKITGHLDGFIPNVEIQEYKTSTTKNKWTQKIVDNWGQLTFYSLLVYLNYKTPPEKLRLRLFAIPIVEHGDFSYTASEMVNIFETKRTMKDILSFGALIKKTHKEMQEFIHSHS